MEMYLRCLQQPTCLPILQTTATVIRFPTRRVSFITMNRISLDSNTSTNFNSSQFQFIFITCFHIISYRVLQTLCAQGSWKSYCGMGIPNCRKL
jgi:hypothetical protein